MANYRIDYTEVKPGGSHDRQSVIVRGDQGDAVRYLARDAGTVLTGSVEVFVSTKSDETPKSIGSLGF
jgi:hypothetical protein